MVRTRSVKRREAKDRNDQIINKLAIRLGVSAHSQYNFYYVLVTNRYLRRLRHSSRYCPKSINQFSTKLSNKLYVGRRQRCKHVFLSYKFEAKQEAYYGILNS